MSAVTVSNTIPNRNPEFVYITCKYLVQQHGFQWGEEARPVWQRIERPDANGLDIWVYSKATQNARPLFLVPSQYSLTPLKKEEVCQ